MTRPAGPRPWRPRRAAQHPLVYFVHVPKTGGSTVQSYLTSWSPNGYGHAEAFVGDERTWSRALRTADWLSGHTPWEQLEPRLRDRDRTVRLFTCVREPTRQLTSQLNWLVEIHHRGRAFYEGHPPAAQQASEFVRARGLHTPDDVVACLDRFPLLFREVQFHVTVGSWMPSSPADIPAALQRYELVGTSDRLDVLFQAMSGQAPTPRRLNTSRYHFDPDLFRAPVVERFLRDFNRRDEELFAAVVAVNRART